MTYQIRSWEERTRPSLKGDEPFGPYTEEEIGEQNALKVLQENPLTVGGQRLKKAEENWQRKVETQKQSLGMFYEPVTALEDMAVLYLNAVTGTAGGIPGLAALRETVISNRAYKNNREEMKRYLNYTDEEMDDANKMLLQSADLDEAINDSIGYGLRAAALEEFELEKRRERSPVAGTIGIGSGLMKGSMKDIPKKGRSILELMQKQGFGEGSKELLKRAAKDPAFRRATISETIGETGKKWYFGDPRSLPALGSEVALKNIVGNLILMEFIPEIAGAAIKKGAKATTAIKRKLTTKADDILTGLITDQRYSKYAGKAEKLLERSKELVRKGMDYAEKTFERKYRHSPPTVRGLIEKWNASAKGYDNLLEILDNPVLAEDLSRTHIQFLEQLEKANYEEYKAVSDLINKENWARWREYILARDVKSFSGVGLEGQVELWGDKEALQALREMPWYQNLKSNVEGLLPDELQHLNRVFPSKKISDTWKTIRDNIKIPSNVKSRELNVLDKEMNGLFSGIAKESIIDKSTLEKFKNLKNTMNEVNPSKDAVSFQLRKVIELGEGGGLTPFELLEFRTSLMTLRNKTLPENPIISGTVLTRMQKAIDELYASTNIMMEEASTHGTIVRQIDKKQGFIHTAREAYFDKIAKARNKKKAILKTLSNDEAMAALEEIQKFNNEIPLYTQLRHVGAMEEINAIRKSKGKPILSGADFKNLTIAGLGFTLGGPMTKLISLGYLPTIITVRGAKKLGLLTLDTATRMTGIPTLQGRGHIGVGIKLAKELYDVDPDIFNYFVDHFSNWKTPQEIQQENK